MKNKNIFIKLFITIIITLFLIISCSAPQGSGLDGSKVNKIITTEPGKVSTPTYSLSAGTYDHDIEVEICCSTSDTTIYYTTDGSNPTTSSSVYSTAILVAGHGTNITIKAFAVKSGMTDSNIENANYEINYNKVSTPNFNISAGTYDHDIEVEIGCSTSDTTIYYTTDGSNPTTSSSVYSTAILVAGHGTNITIKAFAVKSGMTDSNIENVNYEINYNKVSTPNFNISAGTYDHDINVGLTCATDGAAIYYTIDGSDPTTSSSIYSTAISIAGHGTNMTIKAIAVKTGMSDSEISFSDYTIEYIKLSNPIFTPSSSNFLIELSVSLSSTTDKAVIRYTIDDSTPSKDHGQIYESKIYLTETTNIKAIAYKSGCITSDIATKTYNKLPIIPPSNVKASDGKYGKKISITWNSVAYSDLYYIYRAESENGYYVEIGTTKNLFFDDNTVISFDAEKKFYYKIKVKYHEEMSDYSNLDSGYRSKTWLPLGDTGSLLRWESDYAIKSYNGSVYLLFNDIPYNSCMSVIKYNSEMDSWDFVGDRGFSSDVYFFPSIEFDNNGVPYVAYLDHGYSQKATVKKFDGSKWVNVGSAGFTSGTAYYPSLAFSPDNTPYIAFTDYANSKKATVMKFNGTAWETVGNAGFSTGEVTYISMAITSSGKIYVGFNNIDGFGSSVRVMEYDGASWKVTGSMFYWRTNYVSLALYNDVPYVAFNDVSFGNGRITLMKFESSSWTIIGNRGFTYGGSYDITLAISKNGIPYVSYNQTYSYDVVVMQYYNGIWELVGDNGIAGGEIYYPTITIDDLDNTPYIIYFDKNSSRGKIMYFEK